MGSKARSGRTPHTKKGQCACQHTISGGGGAPRLAAIALCAHTPNVQARPRPHSSGLLKKARELHEQQQQQRVAGAAGSKPPPQNNIVSTAGLGASAKKGSGAAV